eukprot:SAG22_NODE_16024_length_334_cov_0.876596_1_plen_47_part_10
MLDEPETKVASDYIVVNVFQFFPASFTCEEPGEQRQILIEKSAAKYY